LPCLPAPTYRYFRVTITLPDWAIDYYESFKDTEFSSSEEEMMKVAVEMSRRNVEENTGGPFGTAIFEVDSDTKKCKLFSVGCNRVVPMSNSTLHGEMVAIQFAQQKLKTFSLAKNDAKKEYHLYTSCEPCAMCLGGTLWSGVSKMVCSATKTDAETIGFNEGPVFPESYAALEAAGVKVVRNVLTKEGAEVLRKYGETGVIYNR
jgi:tRNA(Arg) A34 adenosine deaminase TadA